MSKDSHNDSTYAHGACVLVKLKEPYKKKTSLAEEVFFYAFFYAHIYFYVFWLSYTGSLFVKNLKLVVLGQGQKA